MWKEVPKEAKKERKWDGGKEGGGGHKKGEVREQRFHKHSTRLYLTKEKKITHQLMQEISERGNQCCNHLYSQP